MKCKWCGFEITEDLWSYKISTAQMPYNGFHCSRKKGKYPNVTAPIYYRHELPTKEDKVKQLLEKIKM